MIDIENALELQRILITSNLSDEKLRRINELIDLIREDARQDAIDEFYAKCREKYWFSSDFMNFFDETKNELKGQNNE